MSRKVKDLNGLNLQDPGYLEAEYFQEGKGNSKCKGPEARLVLKEARRLKWESGGREIKGQ